VKPKTLTPREIVQVVAALRYWGRAAETSLVHPSQHPMVQSRFQKMVRDRVVRIAPFTLDEIETLIGRLDGTFTDRGLRTWNPQKYL
jgi:hypothetical protein